MADMRFSATRAEMERFSGIASISMDGCIALVKKAYWLGARNAVEVLMRMEYGNDEQTFVRRMENAWRTDTGDMTDDSLRHIDGVDA